MRTKSKHTPEEFRSLIEARKARLEREQQRPLVRSAAVSKVKGEDQFDEAVTQFNEEMAEDLKVLVDIFAKTEGLSDRERFEGLQAVTKVLIAGIVAVEAKQSTTDSETES
jgi:hypothetical protein